MLLVLNSDVLRVLNSSLKADVQCCWYLFLGLYFLHLSFYFCVQVLRSRLSSPTVVFRGESAGQDSRSPRALFEACSQTLERIAQEVKHRFSTLF